MGLLILAAVEIRGGHSLPSWIQVPFLRLQGLISDPIADKEASARPEDLLTQQLKSVDAMQDPERARTLHAGIAKILRAEGTDIERAIHHLEEARNAAVRSDDANTILEARLELSELYIEAGRPQEVDRELDGALRLLTNDNFWEYSVKVDRMKGIAEFESGSIDLALDYFQDAANTAVEPEDIVRCASDIAMAHACLGRAQKSLKPLRDALEVLGNARKSDIMPADLHRTLAVEVHTRLAETFHAMGDTVSSKTHYIKASDLQPKLQSPMTQHSSAIKNGIKALENGSGPPLRCPGGARSQSFKLRTQTDAGKAMRAKVKALLAGNEHKKAELELWNYLETQKQPYKSWEASTALISLANIYLSSDRQSYYKAFHCFRQALRASLACCGAHSSEAKSAFEGLSYVQNMLPTKDQAAAAAAMQEYLDAAESFGASASDLGHKEQVLIRV